MDSTVITKALYKIGDSVPESGSYLCVPCGYVQYFEAGKLFTTCDACFAGTEIAPEGFKDADAEFWQHV
jgi:hypothetical protein